MVGWEKKASSRLGWTGSGLVLDLKVCVGIFLVGREKDLRRTGEKEALRESWKGFLVLNRLYGNVDLDLGWDFYFSLMAFLILDCGGFSYIFKPGDDQKRRSRMHITSHTHTELILCN